MCVGIQVRTKKNVEGAGVTTSGGGTCSDGGPLHTLPAGRPPTVQVQCLQDFSTYESRLGSSSDLSLVPTIAGVWLVGVRDCCRVSGLLST